MPAIAKRAARVWKLTLCILLIAVGIQSIESEENNENKDETKIYQDFYANSEVISFAMNKDRTRESASVIYDSLIPWVIMFYDESNDSKRLVDMFKEVPQLARGFASVGAINCDEFLEFCEKHYNIYQFPSVVYFPYEYHPGLGGAPYKTHDIYYGELEASDIAVFAKNRMPNVLISANDNNLLNAYSFSSIIIPIIIIIQNLNSNNYNIDYHFS